MKIIASQPHIKILLLFAENDTAVPFDPNFKRWVSTFETAEKEMPADTKFATRSFISIPKTKHGFFLEYPELVHPRILGFLDPDVGTCIDLDTKKSK